MLKILEQTQGNLLATKIRGKLTSKDYEKISPMLESKAGKEKEIRWYFEMEDFHGWDLGGLWEDIKVDARHFNDFQKIAMIGDKRWEDVMTKFMDFFTPAEVKYFDLQERNRAMQWIRQ